MAMGFAIKRCGALQAAADDSYLEGRFAFGWGWCWEMTPGDDRSSGGVFYAPCSGGYSHAGDHDLSRAQARGLPLARSRAGVIIAEEGAHVDMWLKVTALSVGGIVGVNVRYWLGVWMSRWASPQFPWATVVVNIAGSFLIGFLTVALARWLPHPNLRLLLITGFLGALTTFSTFENESLGLWERGQHALMAANLAGSVALGFAAVVLGTALARGLVETTTERAEPGSQASGAAEPSLCVPARAPATTASVARPPERGGRHDTSKEIGNDDRR
jgi:CrcB protein